MYAVSPLLAPFLLPMQLISSQCTEVQYTYSLELPLHTLCSARGEGGIVRHRKDCLQKPLAFLSLSQTPMQSGGTERRFQEGTISGLHWIPVVPSLLLVQSHCFQWAKELAACSLANPLLQSLCFARGGKTKGKKIGQEKDNTY